MMDTLLSPLVAVTNKAYMLSDQAFSGGWDLESFLKNLGPTLKNLLSLFLIAIGVACVGWGGFLIAKKLLTSDQGGREHGWFKLIALIIIGGAMMTGGITVFAMAASGGQQTITNLGSVIGL